MAKAYTVTQSFNNDEANHCVDIIAQPDGRFRFQHWRREPEDLSGWILLIDSTPVTFESEPLAIAAASKSVRWFHATNG